MKLIIPGQPIPKARPRFSAKSGIARCFDSQVKQKRWVQLEILKQCRKITNFDQVKFKSGKSFLVRFTFFLGISASTGEGEKNLKLWGLIPCNIKPDLDNLEKFYLDCLNNLLYEDDKNVMFLSSKKYYSNKPRTKIEIEVMDEVTANDKIYEIMKICSPEILIGFLEAVQPLNKIFFEGCPENSEPEEKVANVIQTAYHLSKIAEHYSKMLLKIKNRCPDLYVHFEKIAELERKKELANAR